MELIYCIMDNIEIDITYSEIDINSDKIKKQIYKLENELVILRTTYEEIKIYLKNLDEEDNFLNQLKKLDNQEHYLNELKKLDNQEHYLNEFNL